MNRPFADTLLNLGLIAVFFCLSQWLTLAQPKLSDAQIAALRPIESSAVPVHGNFLILKGQYPNLPYPPLPWIPTHLAGLNLPIYALGSNWFLIDDRTVDYAAINEALRLNQPENQEDGGSGSPGTAYPDGSLWLALTLTNDALYGTMAAVVLNGTTNGIWYEILSKRSLNDSAWWSEGSLLGFTNEAASQASITAYGDAGTLFLWAHALTNGFGGTLPLWWQLQNFGRTGLDPGFMAGAEGPTLLAAYSGGMEPNPIEFSVVATNNHFRTSQAAVQLQIEGGTPFSQSVLLDNTYPTNVSWSTYISTNLCLDLGSVEGWHDVWIGLRGRTATSHPTWKGKRLKLDMTPPVLSLITPAERIVTQPTVQLVGTCPEPLSRIWYSLSNSSGILLDQQVLILDEHQDPTTRAATTSTFQAFDVKLASGTNLLTLHATDLAGNLSETNVAFYLDYTSVTNPPSLRLVWPHDAERICAASFTLHGWIDDPTAAVQAKVVGPNLISRTFFGLVERTGRIWVDDIALAEGTNQVALCMTNAAGKGSITNIIVVRTEVQVTMTPVTPASELWQPTVNVGGTISDPSFAVWVNGVKGFNAGDGTWSATNVPVSLGNAAVFQMTAYGPGDAQPDGSHGN